MIWCEAQLQVALSYVCETGQCVSSVLLMWCSDYRWRMLGTGVWSTRYSSRVRSGHNVDDIMSDIAFGIGCGTGDRCRVLGVTRIRQYDVADVVLVCRSVTVVFEVVSVPLWWCPVVDVLVDACVVLRSLEAVEGDTYRAIITYNYASPVILHDLT